MSEINAVTGVSGYSGRHITRRLVAMGNRVVNLTGHPERPHEFGEQVASLWNRLSSSTNDSETDILKTYLRQGDVNQRAEVAAT